MARNPIITKMLIGAAVVWMAMQIMLYIPPSMATMIPSWLVLPLSGGLAILAVEFISKKTGIMVI